MAACQYCFRLQYSEDFIHLWVYFVGLFCGPILWVYFVGLLCDIYAGTGPGRIVWTEAVCAGDFTLKIMDFVD